MRDKNIPIELDEPPIARDGTWYIALTVTDAEFADALSPDYQHQQKVYAYVKSLHNEYVSTNNYNSLRFQK